MRERERGGGKREGERERGGREKEEGREGGRERVSVWGGGGGAEIV